MQKTLLLFNGIVPSTDRIQLINLQFKTSPEILIKFQGLRKVVTKGMGDTDRSAY